MAGIFGFFLKKNKIETFEPYLTTNNVFEELKIGRNLIGRSVINKLQKDRFLETRNEVTICFEGVNLSEEIKDTHDFFKAYRKGGIKFITTLKGSFSGFILDRRKEKIYIFNDHLGSRNIFYFFNPEIGFIFSSEMKSITKLFKDIKIPFTLNRDAVYMMALYGFILENNTYANEIKKMDYSTILIYDFSNNEFKIHKTFQYSISKINPKIQEAISTINFLFEKSVKNIWSKDLEYGNKHLSFLSGGMDAKTNVLVAKKLGFKNITTLTFGQSNSTDIKYANKVAIQEKFDHFQRFLDYPKYLIEDIMENYIEPLDGLIMFHSSAHASSTIKNFNLKNFSLLHNGQLGDSIFGSFTKPNFNFLEYRKHIGYTGNILDDSLLNKIQILPEFLKKYQDLSFDIFNIEQRQINATLNGDKALNFFIDNISPFSDLELITYCLSLPDSFKKNQLLYFKWLSKHHKNIVNYPWEKIQMKPNNSFKINYGKLYKKYFNGAKKYFNLKYDSMNPYSQWIQDYPFILNTLDKVIEDEIKNPILDKELKDDLIKIYHNNVFEYRNKFAVTTALLAIKLHFKS